MRYSKIDNSLDVMKKSLEWRNIAPTCPDTIPCTPCIDTDPFIMYNCPAIYFSGNCTEFATEIYEGTVSYFKIIYQSYYSYNIHFIYLPGDGDQRTRLVCIPDFCDTQTVALINLSNFECYSMKFSLN